MENIKLAHNVLRKMAADYNEDSNLELEKKQEPVFLHRYYFFNIMKNKDGTEGIDFNNLEDILKRADANGKKGLINKLKSGLVTKNGDNFKWDSIAIKTNKYNGETHKEYVLYYGKLTPAGRRTNNETIIPENKAEIINIEDFIKEHNIYVNKEGVIDAIYLSPDQSSFIEKDATDQDMNYLLKSRGVYKGEMSYSEFKSEYNSNYRVWFEERKELRRPDLSISTSDDFLKENQPYRGTDSDFQKLLKTTNVNPNKLNEQSDLPEESLGKKMDTINQEKSTFKPVDEQKPTTKDEATNKYKDASDKDSKIKEIKKDEPGANYYVGDFSILQDLVKRQHNKMKLRKKAQITSVSPATSGTKKKDNKLVVNLNSPVNKLQEQSKSLKEYTNKKKDLMKEVQKVKKDVSDTMKSMQANSIRNVIELYLK